MAHIEQADVRNHLLQQFTLDDFAVLAPNLRKVDLQFRAVLHGPDEIIEWIYFPEHGYVSLVASLDDGDAAEVGVIGREGVVGVPVLLGTDRSTVEAMVQAGGSALRIRADILRRAMADQAGVRDLLLRYVMAFNVQVTMTAACNIRHLVEQRLARWLLMVHDRTAGDSFPMTHEFLSMMLGVRRAGVSVAAASLQRAGFIQYEQGSIRIVDRAGLESSACECHQTVVKEYRRLFGSVPSD